ncbi:MAG: N-acetylmuramoyl-L-alanine amidase [Sandaracinaceae bacterium]|nr:N-acetylmuramoyl-L-alanine amidase [Sandaracinaceae bacterium]MBK6810113.1 N-acetylmuramoyl-L-alanine amidase [Sandaracinaceae bacterium]MBP7686078.1 N-acetylmuramoyl-L-alanine amidase [Deltaproteobacteria bacterium]
MREAWRAARWLTLTLLGLAACSGGGDAEEAEARPAEHALEGRLAGAGSWSEERLREELVAVDAEQAAATDALARAQLARAGGRLARWLALETGAASDLALARERLTAAMSLPLPAEPSWTFEAELCEAGLELVRLESIDAQDVDAAQRVATDLAERFRVRDDRPDAVGADAPGQLRLLDCVRQARRTAGSLEGSSQALSAADADAGLPAPASDAAVTPAGPVTMTDVAVYSGGALGARAVLRFDGQPVYEVGQSREAAGEPARVWIDVRDATVPPALGEVWRVDSGGLTQVRRMTSAGGGARVIFELAPGARHRVFAFPEPYRLVVDIESRDSVARSVQPQLPEGAPHPTRVIVLDPGHGGTERGATAGGLRESRLALDISTRVAILLRRALPGVRVLLTRQADVTLSLEERTAMANAVGADLFVSVHLNAAEEPVEHGGVTTFVLDTTNQRQANRLAARENGTSTRDVTDLQRLLAGLHRQEQVALSRELAESIHRGTLAGGRRVLPRLPDRGVRSAMFHVLVGARMPAVLLEASFLSKPEEAAALGTARYRQALAEGIAAGIARYVTGS